MSLQRVPFEKSLMPSPSHLLATHHSPLFPPTCPQDSFGTGFRPVLFSAPRPVSFSSHPLLPFLDEHGFSTRRVDPERRRRFSSAAAALREGGALPALLSTLVCRPSTAF